MEITKEEYEKIFRLLSDWAFKITKEYAQSDNRFIDSEELTINFFEDIFNTFPNIKCIDYIQGNTSIININNETSFKILINKHLLFDKKNKEINQKYSNKIEHKFITMDNIFLSFIKTNIGIKYFKLKVRKINNNIVIKFSEVATT